MSTQSLSTPLPYHGIVISDEERAAFERDGYFIVRNAIARSLQDRLDVAMDRVYAQEKAAGALHPDDASLHLMGFLHRDRTFLELLELPTVLPLVRGILGCKKTAVPNMRGSAFRHPRSPVQGNDVRPQRDAAGDGEIAAHPER